MQSSDSIKPASSSCGRFLLQGAWASIGVAGFLLWASIAATLWREWTGDPSLSHGPLVVILAGVHLWMQRDTLRKWDSANPAGLVCLVFSSCVFVGAVFVDIVFMKPLALIGMTAGAIWFLAGWSAFSSSIGALGILVFMIPWPTTLIDRIGFPLQMMSSSYTALLCGLCGMPIHQEGVQLAIIPNSGAKPIYSILVAQKCSGLTSLTVLLALGYLIAYHTDVKLGWQALMVAAVVPLALITNVVRLTFILLAGAHSTPAVADWIHHHEAPVLILFCSLGMMGLRHAIVSWVNRTSEVLATLPCEPDSSTGSNSGMFVIPSGPSGNKIDSL